MVRVVNVEWGVEYDKIRRGNSQYIVHVHHCILNCMSVCVRMILTVTVGGETNAGWKNILC